MNVHDAWPRLTARARAVPRRPILIAGATVFALVATSLIVLPLVKAEPRPTAQRETTVAGQKRTPEKADPAVTGRPFTAPDPVWPAAATVEVDLPSTGAQVGGLPFRLERVSGAGRIRLQTFDQPASRSAGVTGVLLRMDTTDGTPATVRVGLDYSAFRGAYGAGWASRLRLAQLPVCAQRSPQAPECAAMSVPHVYRNDIASRTVTAEVTTTGGGTLLALSAAASGSAGSSAGDYAATSLTPSATWSAGGSAGDLSWNYPMRVPPSLGGPAPSVALSYSSSAVDGKMVTTNNQPSVIGEGFEYSPGTIERHYRACAEDMTGSPSPNNASTKTGDLCWATDNATLSLSGHAGELIKEPGASNRWHLRNDDGTKVERRLGAANGARDGEYWVVTTTDGGQYTFGSSTGGTLTEPVYGNHPGEPCNQATYAASGCTQAYRWHLESVVDPHRNSMTYSYAKETGKYARNATRTDLVTYDRGSYLTTIDYGTRTDGSGPAPQRVSFDHADRCLSGCTTHDAAHWPDTPWDQQCSASPCDVVSPTFWVTKRLTGIVTKVWSASLGDYQPVESWGLEQSFPDPGDGNLPGLWLDKIKHAGLVGGTTTLPDMTIVGVQLSNRVDAIDESAAMKWFRIKTVNSESGGKLTVTYSEPDCVAGSRVPNQGALENNTLRCYPVKWKPNGLNTAIVDYFHKYVVTDVTETDLTGGAVQTRTHYDYLGDPAWHYTDDDGLITPDDKTWSVWRGYAAVRTVKGEPGEQTSVETRYFRGMHGDHLPSGTRSVTLPAIATGGVPAVTDEDAYAGMVRETVISNGPGGAEVSATVNEPWQSAATATRTINGVTVSARFTGTAATHTRTSRDGGRSARTTTVRNTIDATYGDVSKVDDNGDDAVTGDERCTLTDHTRNTTNWLLTLPSRQRRFAVSCAAAAAGGIGADDVISDDLTSYDGLANGAAPTVGDATKTETLDTFTGGVAGHTVSAETTYDAYGRVTQVKDVRGGITTTAYSPANGPVTQTTVTNPLGWPTVTTLNPAWGATVATVDVNGRRTELDMDPLGRLVSVWLPGRDRGQPASSTYAYLYRTDGAITVTARTLNQNGGYVTAYTLYDGLLRLRQVQSADATGGPKAIVTDTLYDSAGRISTVRKPYLASVAPSTDLFNPTGTIPAQTRTLYDGAGRSVAAVFQVQASPASPGGTEKWRTTTSYGGDRVDVVPPAGGTRTSTVTDAAGVTVELRQYHAGVTPGPAVPATGYDATVYRHNRKGQVDRVTDPAGNRWDYTFDLHNRQLTVTDPDKGLTTMVYNAGGLLETSKDARNTTIAYTYDILGRRTSVRDNGVTGPKRAEWTYDNLSNGTTARGQVVKSIRYATPTETYEVETLGFTAGYQPTSVKYTIPPTEQNLAGTFSYVYTYKQDGSTATMRMPALGDLATETLTYGYTDQAKYKSLGTNLGTSYVTGMDYTSFGEPGAVHLGNNGGAPVDVVRTYDQDTRRLAQIWTSKQSPAATVADVRYGYDNAGNVTKVDDITAGDHQCFETDHLGRLAEAWTPTSGDCQAARSVGALGGPAPYWQSFAYDVAGNRSGLVEHLIGQGQRTTTYATTAGTHRLADATITDNGGTRSQSYQYDETGNTKARPAATGQQNLTWDAEGMLASSSDATGTTTYVYDADGHRLIRRDPAGKTLYLPGQELRFTSATGAKTCTRYYSIGDQSVGTRTAAGLTWLISDQQGTANISVNAVSLTVAVRRTDPYGTVRGGTGTWPAKMDKGFVGGTVDNTGLVHLGAREYDPAIGRFVSVDPLIDNTEPQQMNGYSYGNDAPHTNTDPHGGRSCSVEDARQGCKEPEHHLPPISDQYDTAGDEYFGDVKNPGDRRYTIKTGPKAPGQGIIICRFFIPEKDAAGGYLLGDDRDFSLNADVPYRITMAWNTDTGEITYTVCASTIQEQLNVPWPVMDSKPPFVRIDEVPLIASRQVPALPIEKGGANDATVVSARENHLDIQYSGLNSALPCCEVNGEIWIDVNDKGDIRVDLTGDDYPNFEVVQYRPGQVPRSLGRDSSGVAGGGNSMPFTLPRRLSWVNGECVTSFC
ncbi:RHS repeat-associated core domain-containing protein [Dactylosporangium maewongense]|uniref:RHS repeat-associated core domain-containing protein n=1 Tax=Dactylosporangium maewongense TaxID=634393 RepID=A0ABN1ZNC0_9ACTN